MGFVARAARVSVGPVIGSAALMFLALVVMHGQARDASLRVAISSESGIARNDLTLELSPTDAPWSAAVRVPASTLGDFSIAGIRPGEYRVRVTDQYGNVLSEQYVRVSEFSEPLKITLPAARGARPAAGTVSAARLAHKVPKPALKEFSKAERATKDGDEESAVAHLEKAIAIDPEYMEALNNLGAKYLRARKAAEAVDLFTQALRVDPSSAPVLANAAAARLTLQQYPQAEEAARKALKSDPAMVRARFLLGMSLAAQKRQDDVALENLQAAAGTFPKAHMIAADILMRQGDQARAAAALRAYLAGNSTEGRELAKAWLAEIEQHRLPQSR